MRFMRGEKFAEGTRAKTGMEETSGVLDRPAGSREVRVASLATDAITMDDIDEGRLCAIWDGVFEVWRPS